MATKEILKPFNQCSMTGYEQKVLDKEILSIVGDSIVISDELTATIECYQSNVNTYRLVAIDSQNLNIISSVLISDFEAVQRFTAIEHRRKHLQDNLWLLAQVLFRGKVYHSQDMTKEGQTLLYRG